MQSTNTTSDRRRRGDGSPRASQDDARPDRRQTKQALAEHGIDIGVFFLVPSSGDAVFIFGCPADPDDPSWSNVAAIVSPIVGSRSGWIGRDADQLRVPPPPIWSLITSPASPSNRVNHWAGRSAPMSHTSFAAFRSRAPMKYREITSDRFRLPDSAPDSCHAQYRSYGLAPPPRTRYRQPGDAPSRL